MNEIISIINGLKKNNMTGGIKRHIDELGRVVIPVSYRRGKVVDGETSVVIYVVEDYVVVEVLEQKQENSRQIDELGRVIINIDIRRKLNLKEKDQVEMWNCGKYFVLKKD